MKWKATCPEGCVSYLTEQLVTKIIQHGSWVTCKKHKKIMKIEEVKG